MQLARFLQATDWTAPGAIFNSCYLDTAVYVSTYGHPAVVGTAPITSTSSFAGGPAHFGSPLPADVHGSAFGVGANLWQQVGIAVMTSKVGDTYSFSTTARQVTIQFDGIVVSGGGFVSGDTGLTSGVLRNGAVATVSVDGVVDATVDTYGAAPAVTLFLDGVRRTILITHTGGYSTSLHPIGPVTPLVGTSVSNGLSLTPLFHPTLITASWRILATASGTYTLFRTLPGASETTIATGLVVGTTYADSAHVPGVSVVLTGTLTTSDSATFTTDITEVAFSTITLSYSSGGAGGVSYVSPIVDSGTADTQWFTGEWTQSTVPALSGFALATGQTPLPDGSWSTYAAPVVNTVLPDAQTPQGVAGLMAAPRGRYAQYTATFAIGTSVPPYIRDLALSYWVPERDPQFMSKMAFGESWAPGRLMCGYFGALAVELATARQRALDYVGSFGISGAVDPYLEAYGSDYGFPQYTGEQQTTYRQRLLAARRSHPDGGSLAFIAEQAALLTGFPLAAIGATTLAGAYQFQITIPAPVSGSGGTAYPNLPGLPVAQAQVIISDCLHSITPVTNILTIVFT